MKEQTNGNTGPKKLLEDLGLTADTSRWENGWDDSMKKFSEDKLVFLQPGFLVEQARKIGMDEAISAELPEGLELFEKAPELKRLIFHYHRTMFIDECFNPGPWPPVHTLDLPGAQFFFLYMYLSGVPYIFRKHAEIGIERQITLDTLSDIEVWVHDYKQKHGRFGFDCIGWLYNHFSIRLFKLGRLEFEFSKYHHPYMAYRHAGDGRMTLVVEGGKTIRGDGQFDGVNEIHDAAAWETIFEEKDDYIVANPISPSGYICRETIRLDRKNWECVLKNDDTTMGVHIAAKGPMGHTECGKSFRSAEHFFKKYYPAFNCHAYTCTSWLMDPQLEGAVKPESNIVRFLQEWYLTPNPWANDNQIFGRVFGGRPDDLDSAPQKNSLQRAVVAHVKAGKRWRTSSAVIFPEHVPEWGKQPYRDETRFGPGAVNM